MYPEDLDHLPIDSKESFLNLDAETRVAFCLHQLEAEVNNGGFGQFFFNSSGEYTNETVSALRAIGAEATAKLLEKAIAIAYPTGFPADATLHQAELSGSDETLTRLGELDDAFYAYPDNLAGLVNSYLTGGT